MLAAQKTIFVCSRFTLHSIIVAYCYSYKTGHVHNLHFFSSFSIKYGSVVFVNTGWVVKGSNINRQFLSLVRKGMKVTTFNELPHCNHKHININSIYMFSVTTCYNSKNL